MGGGIIQLSAYGSQDVYLTGNPQITFFKSVYYRHTNFSMEAVEAAFGGEPDFGRTLSCTLPKSGDLLHKMYLEISVPALKQEGSEWATWTNGIAHALIKSIEIQIGGELVDKHYGEWLDIQSELTIPESKRLAFDNMIGKFDGLESGVPHYASAKRTFFVPLRFWFCKSIGDSLPIIALQHQDVKLNVTFRPINELVLFSPRNTETSVLNTDSQPVKLEASLYIDYIYLDINERKKFVQQNHEYLIEQLQYEGQESISINAEKFSTQLNFSHPVKEIIWTITQESNLAINYKDGNRLLDYTPRKEDDINIVIDDEFITANIKFNGMDRFTPRKPNYFKLVQPFEHHTRVPADKYIYCYSFAIKPEETQPSGSCNMSCLDQATLNLTFPSSIIPSIIKVYAINYNVLRIMSGMSGLAYVN